MATTRVTCPETAHLETIELEHHPLGILITGCSRFSPEETTCSRRCAVLLDRRERATCGSPDLDDVILASLQVGDQTRYDLDLDAPAATPRRDS